MVDFHLSCTRVARGCASGAQIQYTADLEGLALQLDAHWMRPRRNWRRALALALVAVARRKVAGALMCEPTKKGQPGRSGRRQGRQGRVSTMQQIRALSTRQLANYTRNPVRVRRSPREVSPAVARWTRWQRGPRLNGDVVVSFLQGEYRAGGRVHTPSRVAAPVRRHQLPQGSSSHLLTQSSLT